MTVEELIDILKTCDPDAYVVITMQTDYDSHSSGAVDITEANRGQKNCYVEISGYVD